MAHQALKPYSFLMYLLAVIACFLLGLVYADITEAGKGQMLAGGAIVFGYGVIGAFIGLCLSILTAIKMQKHIIIKINAFLTLIIIVSFMFFTLKYQKYQLEKLENEHPKKERPTTPK